METRIISSGEDCSRMLDFLRNRADGVYISSNVTSVGWKDNGNLFHGTYVILQSSAKKNIMAMLCHCWNRKILISSEPQVSGKELRNALALCLSRTAGRHVDGFLGTSYNVKKLLEACELLDLPTQLHSSQIMLVCELNCMKIMEGKPVARPASLENLELLNKWTCEFLAETNQRSCPSEEIDDLLKYQIKEKKRWILVEEDETIVSMAAINAMANGSVMIGAVYTPVEFRSNKYARTLLSGMLHFMQKEMEISRAFLFTSDSYALRSYTAIGFKECGDYAIHLLKNPIDMCAALI